MADYGRRSAAEWIDKGSAVGIDDRGWSEFDAPAPDGDIPALEVHLLVVGGAQQATVVDSGQPIVDPVLQVVRGADSRWSIAAGKNTPAIPRDQGAANAYRDGAHCPANVERLGVTPMTTGITLQSHAIRRAAAALISCP